MKAECRSHGRVIFTNTQFLDDRGVFSVEANGWVVRWSNDNPQVAQVMYPPHTVRVVMFDAVPDPKENA